MNNAFANLYDNFKARGMPKQRRRKPALKNLRRHSPKMRQIKTARKKVVSSLSRTRRISKILPLNKLLLSGSMVTAMRVINLVIRQLSVEAR